jgi:nicotinamide riboside kinase
MTARKIAVVGGECTGKTLLCQALADALPGLWVPEYLREFVDRHARVPRQQDQAVILATQIRLEADAVARAAAVRMGWVACDSAPIATAIYSAMYFGDRSLEAIAERHHATYALTLLTDTDLPWEPDGAQRDGPAVRAEFDARIDAWLGARGIPFARIRGHGAGRIDAARTALRVLQSPPR